jgi:UDP-3-O-[3-hydroxymyristoyl] glucosamine N-acyltransferase
MPKPLERGIKAAPALTVEELARLLGCPYEGDGETLITGVAGLEQAKEGDLVFLAHPKYRKQLEKTKAAAAIVTAEEPFRRIPVLLSSNPQLAFVRAVEFFFQPYRPGPGVHPSALISPSAGIGRDAAVGPFCVIGDDVEIGDDTVLHPLVTLYPRVKIGRKTVIHSQVSIREDVRIGDRVIIHNGAVIGSDGFGYVEEAGGSRRKIPQKGTVVIEDDVEIGANATVDRAALGETIIRRGVKIDNLVQVAHNVEIGENSVLAALTGIAGSSKIGKGVIMGGQVGVPDHVEVGDKAILAAKSGIISNVPAGAFVAGFPHIDIRDWRKVWVVLPKLYGFIKDLKKLRARVEELEKAIKKE